MTVDRSRVEQPAAEGDAGAIGVLAALRTLSTQLSGAQVGITVTNLAIGFLAEPAISELISPPLEAIGIPEDVMRPLAIGLGLAIGSTLTMIFGELVPKNLAIAKPMETARATQRLHAALHDREHLARSSCSTAPPTRSSARSAWSRRRSCARRARRPSSRP